MIELAPSVVPRFTSVWLSSFIRGYIVLNFDSIATMTDDDMLTNLAVRPDARSCEDMRRMPNTHSLAYSTASSTKADS